MFGGGSLTVQVGPMNPAAQIVQPNQTNVTLLQLELIAGPLEPVNITQITFGSFGTGNEPLHSTG
jgi:hypothetical protein